MKYFELPDVGEGLTEAELVRWHVRPGDTVSVNDVICEIETAKSLVELPSPHAGTVAELLVDEGETVAVGTRLFAVGDTATDEGTPPGEGVLVGYGLASRDGSARSAGVRRRRRARLQPSVQSSSCRPLAKPPVRWLARELGVALDSVPPTGAAGEITRADVVLAGSGHSASRAQVADPRRTPVRGVRRATAAAMSASAFSAPHVTVWKEVDATRTMELVRRLKRSDDYRDVRVSPLLLMARAVLRAAARTPELNASWVDDADGAAIVRHDAVNLGIAAATPRGLLVPNIRAAEQLSMHELAVALQDLTEAARSGRTTPAAQQGGTITITNIGVFGVDGGTPILNPGESAIIAFGTIAMKPWVVDGEVRPREVLTIAGSFDHRVADGDAMSRFVADVAAVIEEPALLVA